MTLLKTLFTLAASTALLAACGGGGSSTEDNQQITSVTVRALSYSRQAVLLVSGVYLRDSMAAATGICKDPVFNMTQSTPQLAVLNCAVTATGEQPLVITGTNGKLLYSGSLTVPLPQVDLVTSQGSVLVELDPAAAPLTVTNFLTYVNSGYYDNTLFHRVIPSFVVQGGGYLPGLIRKAGQRPPIVLESNKGLSNARGTLAMARTTVPDSATSEFFINLVDNPTLDYLSPASPGYAVFGKVLSGLEVIDAVATQPTTLSSGFRDVPVTDVILQVAQQVK